MKTHDSCSNWQKAFLSDTDEQIFADTDLYEILDFYELLRL